MVKKSENKSTLSYLYLALLAFITAIGLEVVTERYMSFTLPELTMKLTVSAIYILSAAMMMAFIANLKLDKDQKYIFFLVVLSLTFFRVITFLKGIAF